MQPHPICNIACACDALPRSACCEHLVCIRVMQCVLLNTEYKAIIYLHYVNLKMNLIFEIFYQTNFIRLSID